MSALGDSARRDRVTGRLEFADDIKIEGALHGALVRTPHRRAVIESLGTDAASQAPGVVRVFTAADFGFAGPPRFGPEAMDQPILAVDEVKYEGEPVALVVADTLANARRAADLVEVAARPLPGWHTVEGALSNPPLHASEDRVPPQAQWRHSNIMAAWEFGWGDVAAGAEEAALVIENRYRAPFAHHFAIETYSAVAIPDGDGVVIWDAVQHPFLERRVVAEMLELPLESVRVRAINMGGSFGGKAYPKLGPVVATFSRLLGRPLRITLSAEESFQTGQREASDITVRTGFDEDGRLVFQDLGADFLVGAYTDISTRVVSKAGLHACGPYRFPSARIHARGVFTTTPPTTAFRGFGAPHIALAIEGQMDEAAHRLGIDPLELRLRNIKHMGEPTVEFETPVDGDWPGLLRMAADQIGWDTPTPAGRGRGLAFGIKSCVPATESTAQVRLGADGSVAALVGTSEMGQGANLAFARLVGEWLDVDPAGVEVVMADTGVVPFDSLTASSRSLVHMGNALQAACEDVKRQMANRPDWAEHGDLTGEGSFAAPKDDRHPLGGRTPFFEAVVTAVELSVDAETGLIEIDKLVHVTDAGKVINRSRAIGMDDGGVVMGLGLALSEHLAYGDDGLVGGSSLDYRIPTAADIPTEMVGLFAENGDGPGPDGAKGIAEGGVLAVAPAIAAALFQCAGVRLRQIPFTPERVWRAMHATEDDPR